MALVNADALELGTTSQAGALGTIRPMRPAPSPSGLSAGCSPPPGPGHLGADPVAGPDQQGGLRGGVARPMTLFIGDGQDDLGRASVPSLDDRMAALRAVDRPRRQTTALVDSPNSSDQTWSPAGSCDSDTSTRTRACASPSNERFRGAASTGVLLGVLPRYQGLAEYKPSPGLEAMAMTMTMHPDATPGTTRKAMSLLHATHSHSNMVKPLPPTPSSLTPLKSVPVSLSPASALATAGTGMDGAADYAGQVEVPKSPGILSSAFAHIGGIGNRLIGLNNKKKMIVDSTRHSGSAAIEYFVATMSRSEAEYLLQEFGRHIDGAFLFRKSRDTVILSLCAQGDFHHYTVKLQKMRGKSNRDPTLWLDKQLQRFVKHHRKKRSKSEFACELTIYVTYQNAGLTHEPSEEQSSPKLRERKLSAMPAVYSTIPRSPRSVLSAARVDRDFGAEGSPRGSPLVSSSDLGRDNDDVVPEKPDCDPDYDEAKNLRTRSQSIDSNLSAFSNEAFVEVPDALRRKQTHVYDDTGGLDPNASISCPPTVWQNSRDASVNLGLAPVLAPSDFKRLRKSRSFDTLDPIYDDSDGDGDGDRDSDDAGDMVGSTTEPIPGPSSEVGSPNGVGGRSLESSEGPVQFTMMPGASKMSSVLSSMHSEPSGPSRHGGLGDISIDDDDDDDDGDLSEDEIQNLGWLTGIEEVVEEDEEFELLSTAPRFKLSVNRGLAKVAKGHQFMSATA